MILDVTVANDFPKFVDIAISVLLVIFFVNIFLITLRKITNVRSLLIMNPIMVQQVVTITVIALLILSFRESPLLATITIGIL